VDAYNTTNKVYFLTKIPQRGGTQDFTSRLIQEGRKELQETEALFSKLDEVKNRFPNKKVVLADIGVHIGWYTLNAAARGFGVKAFEAFSENRKILKYEMCFNDPRYGARIDQVHFGLSETSQECGLYSRATNTQNGMISCTEEERPGTIFREFVKLESLDSQRHLIGEDEMIGLLKIDTEGFELSIFRGAKLFIKTYRPPYIMAEYNPLFMRTLGYKESDYWNILEELGYEVHVDSFDGPLVPNLVEYRRGRHQRKLDEIFLIRKDYGDMLRAEAATQ
jgi:FkbM family methyltransferase